MKLFNLRFKVFLRDKFILLSLILSLFFNVLVWLLLYTKIPHLVDGTIVLHYNIYFSIDLIGPWWQILLLPLSGLAILLINLFFSYLNYKQSRLISCFLLGFSGLMQVIIFLASLALIYVNL